MTRLLLDTCALVWTALGEPMPDAARESIEHQPLHVSSISALEVAMLAQRNKLMLEAPTRLWFATLVRRLAAKVEPLEPDLLIESAELMGDAPRDPFDRIVITTARRLGLKVVTRDRLILAYCERAGVAALAC